MKTRLNRSFSNCHQGTKTQRTWWLRALVAYQFNFKKNSVLLLMAVFLISCDKEVTNAELPAVSPKLVVTSFISPQDSLLRVSVSRSAPAFGSVQLTEGDVLNATVTMSDGSRSAIFMYSEQERQYVADTTYLKIEPGKTYFLQAGTPDGLRAEASCTVPRTQNTSLTAAVDSADSRYDEGKEYFVRLRWQDTPGETNYYRVSAEVEAVHNNPEYTNSFYEVYWENTDLFSDNRLDGAGFSSASGGLYYLADIIQDDYYRSARLIGYLLNTDENYYRYHQSLRTNDQENPFAEPTLIYSNVQNGLGVFAAYTRTAVVMELK